MNRIPIVLDCDPGVDDAIAILLACRMPEFDLRLVTSVAGNVEAEKTAINALRLLEIAGSSVPVVKGAETPLFRAPVVAAHIHGKNGLGDLDVPMPAASVAPGNAWDAIYQEAVRQEGKLEIIAIGPLTNLALAFIKYRELPKLLRRIVIMGGAATMGNATPAAEFNIYADAEAADIVFTSGVPVYMCGLDVTMRAFLTPDEIEQMGALGSKQARFLRDLVQGVLRFSLDLGLPGMNMHDPAAVLYAADDSIFETHHAGIRVETKGKLTYGKTVTDLYSDHQMEHNAYIVTDVDREKLKARMFDILSRY